MVEKIQGELCMVLDMLRVEIFRSVPTMGEALIGCFFSGFIHAKINLTTMVLNYLW